MNKFSRKQKYVKPTITSQKIKVKLFMMDYRAELGFYSEPVYLACVPSEECCGTVC